MILCLIVCFKYVYSLQIALVMGNGVLNEVLEANITDLKPTPESTL